MDDLLKGLRVLDSTTMVAMPTATHILADMGAEVIKIEGPKFPDPVRTGISGGALPTINLSPYYNEYNPKLYVSRFNCFYNHCRDFIRIPI